MDVHYRRSTPDDEDIIREIVHERFGARDIVEPYSVLQDRYLMAFDGDKLIAITGMYKWSDKKYEVDWTCVKHGYEGNGLITTMIRKCMEDIPDGARIICSCWRLSENGTINLHHAMNELGFKLVERNYKVWDKVNNEWCDRCAVKQGEDCKCWEDLYDRIK